LNRSAALAVSAATLVAGCYSQSPLDSSPQVALDTRLLGTWRCVSADPRTPQVATATFAVGPVARDRAYVLTWQDTADEAESYRAFLSKLGSSTFLNVRPLKEDRYSGWAFLRYSFLRANVVYVEFARDEPFREKASTASSAAARATLERALQTTPETLAEFATCMKSAAGEAQP
jgi:hypothetical protein